MVRLSRIAIPMPTEIHSFLGVGSSTDANSANETTQMHESPMLLFDVPMSRQLRRRGPSLLKSCSNRGKSQSISAEPRPSATDARRFRSNNGDQRNSIIYASARSARNLNEDVGLNHLGCPIHRD